MQQSYFFTSRPHELNAQPKYPAVQCSGSTTSCLLYGEIRAEVRPHMFPRSVRVLQEAGRVPSSGLVSRALWRAEQKSHFQVSRALNAQPHEYPAVLCSGSTRSCLPYGQRGAEVRPHNCFTAVRVLQEPGRVPSNLFLGKSLWRAEQQSHVFSSRTHKAQHPVQKL